MTKGKWSHRLSKYQESRTEFVHNCRHPPIEFSSIVERFFSVFEVGFALMQIRDNKLYRESYGTFEEYCQAKWSMTKRYANYLISSSEVMDNLGTVVPKEMPERVLRPLTSLPPDQQKFRIICLPR